MAHCPIAQLTGPKLPASLCGATGFTSPVLSSVFPGISTPFQGFAATFIPGTRYSTVTYDYWVVASSFVRQHFFKHTDW
jgi:hypothetical protein